jgi:TP901 family phage tail tape measure protein
MGGITAGAMGLGLIISLRDQASQGLEKIKQKIQGLKGVSSDMLDTFAAGAGKMLSGLGIMGTGALVLKKAFTAPITAAMNFEQAMAEVGAISRVNAEDMKRLTENAREMGRATRFSATEAAMGQKYLAMAGFKTEQIIATMPGMLDLAAAAGMDLARTSDIASNILTGFGLDASEMTRVANVMALAFSSSNTDVEQLGYAMKYAAPLAKTLGFSIEETAAVISKLSDAGIQGQMAGTTLRGMLDSLVDPTKEAQKVLDTLKVNPIDKNGDLRALPNIIKDIDTAMTKAGLGSAERAGRIQTLFGARAGTGANAIWDAILSGEMGKLTEKYINEQDGAVKEMADKMNNTAKGALIKLGSALESIAIDIGNILLPIYTGILSGITWFVSMLNKLPKPVLAAGVTLIGLAGTGLMLAGALLTVSGATKALSVAWMAVKPQIISAIAGISWKVWAFAALAGILYAAWKTNFGGLRDMIESISTGIGIAFQAGTDGIVEVDKKLVDDLKAKGLWDYVETVARVVFRIRKFAEGLAEGWTEAWERIGESWDAFKESIRPAVEFTKPLLKALGILDLFSDSGVDKWKEWGNVVGKFAAVLLPALVALKAFRIGKSIFGAFSALKGAAAAVSGTSSALDIMSSAAGRTRTATSGMGAVLSRTLSKSSLMSVGVSLGVIAGAAWLFYKNWDKVSAAWDEGWEKIKADLANGEIEQAFIDLGATIGNSLKPVLDDILKPIGDWLGGIIQKVGTIAGGTGKAVEGWLEEKGVGLSEEGKANSYAYSQSADMWSFGGGAMGGYDNPPTPPASAPVVPSAPTPAVSPAPTPPVSPAPAPAPIPASHGNSADLLASNTATKATAPAAVAQGTMQGAVQRPPEVNMNVTVEPQEVKIILDGKEIGKANARYQTHEDERKGRSYGWR